uniref:lipocalin family protein n=1 Tax=Confluentibacter citreus TaxID=2007307 RepID=UPI001957EEA8
YKKLLVLVNTKLGACLPASDFPSENPRPQTRNFPYTNTLATIKEMKRIYLLTIAIVFASCSNKINLNQLTGTWIETESSDMYESNRIREISFFENGTYQHRTYNLNDSLLSKFDGTFELNKETNTIKITNSGYKLKDMNLNKLTESELKAVIIEHMDGIEDIEFTAELHFIKK